MQNRSEPSNSIWHNFCLTRGSTLTSQDYSPISVVCVPKLIRAIWRYLPSLWTQLVVMTLCQYSTCKISVSTNYFGSRILARTPTSPRNRVFALSSLILTYWDNCDSSVTKLTGLYSIFWHELFCMLVSVSQKYWCIWQLQRKSLTKCKRVKIKKKKSTFLTGGS